MSRGTFIPTIGPDSDVVNLMLIGLDFLYIRLRGGTEFNVPIDKKMNGILTGEFSINVGEPIPLELLDALREYQA